MVRFAVIGLGMGRNRAQQIIDTDGAELVVVVDTQSELAVQTSEEMECEWDTDYSNIINRSDIDVVMVMTPSGTHAEIGVQAANAGKHVLTTKPMDVSTEACDSLIKAGDENNVLIGVDYQSRYVDSNVRIAEAIKRNLFGRILLAEVRFKWYRSDDYFAHNGGWRGTWTMDGGGSLANQGSHLIDLLLWFMGDPVRVYAETAITNHDIETEDIGMAILNFSNGAKGTILGTTTFPENTYFSAEVHGTKGGVIIDSVLSGEMRVFGDGIEDQLNSIQNDRHNAIADMVSAVRRGTSLRVDGREGRRTVSLLEDIYESAKCGEVVENVGD